MKKHVHQWKRWSRTDEEVAYRCSECKAERTRPTTAREKAAIKRHWRRFDRQNKAMHRVYHDFTRRFLVKDGDGNYSVWKWTGYELMERVDKWAKKHPKDVITCGIDDTHHACSDLVFILHRVKRRLWGTSCVVLTQCDGIPPKEYFMYPGHRAGIQEALAKMATYGPMGL